MIILDQISLEINPKKIVAAIFQGKACKKDWLEKVQLAIRQILPALHPLAVYELFAVEKLTDQHLVLQRANHPHVESLHLGPNVALVNQAEQIVLSVVTLGEEIDRQIASMNKAGNILEAYLVDSVGIYALMQVSRAVYHRVECLAEERDWGVGSVLSPGALMGWPLAGQDGLCSLLQMDQIGVRLNSSSVLTPQKSVSFLIGMGSGFSSKKVQIPCQVCTNDGNCWCKY